MTEKITLILILHNRHKNIDRLLEYYDDYDFPIVIADSSKEKHVFSKMKPNWHHIFTPNLFFTDKLEVVLPQITTPYLLMCADDDFIIPKSIIECVSFLEANSDYTVAQGLAIRYEKDSVAKGYIEFGPIYKTYQSVEDNEPVKRLQHFFHPYRSIFYAVFRTQPLQESFAGTGSTIKKLFLNEYITAFLPILFGKYKEFPILYHVREHAHDSDDKTAVDIDTLTREKQYQEEVEKFEGLVATKMAAIINIPVDKAAGIVKSTLSDFAQRLGNLRNHVPFKKKIGNIIAYIPVLGKWMIKKNRETENKNRLSGYFDIDSEPEELKKISDLLFKYDQL